MRALRPYLTTDHHATILNAHPAARVPQISESGLTSRKVPLRWAPIHIANEASAEMRAVTEVRAVPGRGLEGDRDFLGTGLYSA